MEWYEVQGHYFLSLNNVNIIPLFLFLEESALEQNCQNDLNNKTAENNFAYDTSEIVSFPKESKYVKKSKKKDTKKKSKGN